MTSAYGGQHRQRYDTATSTIQRLGEEQDLHGRRARDRTTAAATPALTRARPLLDETT
jgi:hypothetical protein